jgi:spore coat protein U-like protein
MRKQVIGTISAGILLALAGTAQAATKTATFGVSATVAQNCFVGATNLAFGTYTGQLSNDIDSSSDVTVRCTKNAPYTLSLNTGTTNGSNYVNRLLTNGTDTLQYNLYTTAARDTVWGDGTGSSTVGGTGTGLANTITHTVYGRLFDNPFNQAAGVGNYTDSVTVTVTY